MTTPKLSIPTGIYVVCAYAFLLPLSLLFAAVIWANKVSGVLYLCTDISFHDYGAFRCRYRFRWFGVFPS
jgi:hypothetical protein